MNKQIFRAWTAILLYGAVAAATTGPLFDQTVPLIVLSCVSFGTGIAFYILPLLTKAAYLAPTFGALGSLFFALAFRTSSASTLLSGLMIAALIAAVVMAIADLPKGRLASQ